ncbi:hypothetical protein RB595_004509 [Gaeumannomyces hyphopodioides]
MAFDDDAVPAAAQPSGGGAAAAAEEIDDEVQDFRQFSSVFNKKGFSSQSIRKGEKDFEAHGTRAQETALEQSRRAMEEVLEYERVHKANNWCRGWYFPDAWAVHPEDGGGASRAARDDAEQKREVCPRDRVVALEADSGRWLISTGRYIPNVSKSQPGWNKLWLLPEEALFLVERGSLDLWWPTRPLEELFPGNQAPQRAPPEGPEEGEATAATLADASEKVEVDEYDLGVPLSLQAAYSLLIGHEGERGKVTLEKYQVYANLRRCGYIVLRAPLLPQRTPQPPATKAHATIWQWLFSLIPVLNGRGAANPAATAAYGPLIRPGLYRSYEKVFEQLHIVPRHVPAEHTQEPHPGATDPFRIHYHVWKASNSEGFSKTRPGPPDFHVAIADARDTAVPSLGEVSALLASSPWDPPSRRFGPGPAQLYPRLKHGYRSVVMAVVDRGLVNYVRFAEAAFGEEPISSRFDATNPPRGGKLGARGGGRGGRGRGRGGGRGRHRA